MNFPIVIRDMLYFRDQISSKSIFKNQPESSFYIEQIFRQENFLFNFLFAMMVWESYCIMEAKLEMYDVRHNSRSSSQSNYVCYRKRYKKLFITLFFLRIFSKKQFCSLLSSKIAIRENDWWFSCQNLCAKNNVMESCLLMLSCLFFAFSK